VNLELGADLRARAEAWPSVTAVVPTRNRPQLLIRAVESILAQDYPGALDVIVVVDRAQGDAVVPPLADPRVRIIDNARSPGLAGARNTGTLATDADLIAFCDDDDTWSAGKLTFQVTALERVQDASMASTAIVVDFDGSRSVRLAGVGRVTHDQLIPSRMTMLHSSTFLIRRSALLGDVGLVDEQAPGGQNEDWDLLLRASAKQPIVHVDRPLVTVHWTARSYFSRDWDSRIASALWMLDRHPQIGSSRVGSARVYGQIAFAHASRADRTAAVRWSMRAIRRRPLEPRSYLALAVAAGVRPTVILEALHRRGHGI
jgi:glycosyltransferase involved in cell wall biosynthesis